MPEFIRPARVVITEDASSGFPWGALVGLACLIGAVGLVTWFVATEWPLLLAGLAAAVTLTAVVLRAFHGRTVRAWPSREVPAAEPAPELPARQQWPDKDPWR